MPTRHASSVLVAAALLLCSPVQAQYWDARKILLAVQGSIVVGNDQNGNEVDRFQRAWIQRSADVLDRIAPELGVTSPRFVIERGTAPNAFAVMTRDGPLVGINT